eukprot:CAMPEP_0113629904 /NCGR_PEP_ID=MMETSP0017_2-20120614/15530_1 /TAXON_ID=2856 /ORGANISM="Cylindrotheca closterium" /LENGTH=106 /DNA_ID=CAMNT_0000540333 /DNA_START=72 /DNA_END=392 /DNA_ORIENTATION=+ /assembly_acc=CAM_ASM_000147
METTHLDAELGQQRSYDSTDYERQEDFSVPLSTTSDKLSAAHKDSHVRSLIKGITYRTLSTIATVTITYFVLGDVSVAFEIGFVDFFVKLMIYYMHERAWSFVTFL